MAPRPRNKNWSIPGPGCSPFAHLAVLQFGNRLTPFVTPGHPLTPKCRQAPLPLAALSRRRSGSDLGLRTFPIYSYLHLSTPKRSNLGPASPGSAHRAAVPLSSEHPDDAAVVRSEIVAPIRDAMRLVHHKHADAALDQWQ